MRKHSYYETSALLKKMGETLKESVAEQEELNRAGLMMDRITLETSLLPTSSMKGSKLASNDDLFLSGGQRPPYLKMKIVIATVVKS